MSLKLVYANINGLYQKKQVLYNYLERYDIDGCMLVETKTKIDQTPSYRNWQFLCKHGSVLNNARGGAAALFKPNARIGKANPPSLNNPLNECLHFTIPYGNDKIHFFLVYIHPFSDIEQNIFNKVNLYKHAIVIGDFNINRRKSKQLKTFLENSDFIRRETPPTFLMPENDDTTPDLLLHTTNLTNLIDNIQLTNELGSDHLAITFEIDLTVMQHPIPDIANREKLNLSQTDVSKVSTDVHNHLHLTTETITLEHIQSKISHAVRKFSPTRKVGFYQHTLPRFILRLIKQKRELYRLYVRTQDNALKRTLNSLNRNIKTLIQHYRQDKWLETCQDIENDRGKSFWTKVRKLSQYKKSSMLGNITENGSELYSDQDKADAFARHFCGSFKMSNNPKFDKDNWLQVNIWYNNYFNDNTVRKQSIPITDAEYHTALQKLKNTAPGKDNIQSKILQGLSRETHILLRTQMNECLEKRFIPQAWRSGIIIPIPKNGQDNSQAHNYRPITLLPVLRKFFEQIIKTRLERLTQKRIPEHQFGFKNKNSTIHPLFVITNNIQTTHLNDRRTATLLMDINKAFDSVWHKGMLFRLYELGTPQYLLYTIRNLLNDNLLEIRINDTLSFPFSPEQGLPQGSPLSPLLYNIYCHDIYNHNQKDELTFDNSGQYLLQYADDTALIVHDKTTKNATSKLQLLTNKTMEWFYKWRLTPNPTKNQLLLPNHKIGPNSPTITADGYTTRPSYFVKYLGMTLDSKMKFTKHLRNIRVNITKRAKYFRGLTYKQAGISTHTATKIYKSICRPLLDYGNIILANANDKTKKYIQTTEQITLRLITKIRHPENPLFNPSNDLLYERTNLIKITDRHKKIQTKWKNKKDNWTIINKLCLTRQTRTSRYLTPNTTLTEHYQDIH